MLPSAPVMGDGMVSMTLPVESGDAFGDFFDGDVCDFGVADDAALADVSAACFELRLDQNDGFGERGCRGEDGRKKERGGDERDVHDQQGEGGLARFGECARGEKAGIGALDEADARVVAKLHGDLAEAGIDRGDVGRRRAAEGSQ